MTENEEKLLELKLRMAEDEAPSGYPDWRSARLPGIIAFTVGLLIGVLLSALVKGVSIVMIPVLALLFGAAAAAVAAFRPR